jgi:hypothetical protein
MGMWGWGFGGGGDDGLEDYLSKILRNQRKKIGGKNGIFT